RGLFVRAGDLWGRLAHVRKLVFDKTGTLTLENPALENPAVLATLPREALAVLRAVVHDNPHPVSRAVWEGWVAWPRVRAAVTGEVEEEVGRGLRLGAWTLGRSGWRDDGPVDGATVLACAGRTVARFRFRDDIRRDARAEIAALQA